MKKSSATRTFRTICGHSFVTTKHSRLSYMGYAGLKNGKLLEMAEAAGFDILITGDKTLEYEQNMQGRKIALVACPRLPGRSLNYMFRRL